MGIHGRFHFHGAAMGEPIKMRVLSEAEAAELLEPIVITHDELGWERCSLTPGQLTELANARRGYVIQGEVRLPKLPLGWAYAVHRAPVSLRGDDELGVCFSFGVSKGHLEMPLSGRVAAPGDDTEACG